MWRTLHKLTKDQAQRVVESAADEDGWTAWVRLNQFFSPAVEAQQGAAWAHLSAMAKKQAKSTMETRNLISELMTRIQHVEDLTGEAVNDNHSKSILLEIMDDATKQHTALKHGKRTSFAMLKDECMKFINNATSSSTLRGGTAMAVDMVQGDGEEESGAHTDPGSYERLEPRGGLLCTLSPSATLTTQ